MAQGCMKLFDGGGANISMSFYDPPITSTFGSNLMAFDAIATLYFRENDKQWTPSNVVSHDVTFSDAIDIVSVATFHADTCHLRFDCPNPI
jgi:hypothetical protein